jgi:hypothetical protein
MRTPEALARISGITKLILGETMSNKEALVEDGAHKPIRTAIVREGKDCKRENTRKKCLNFDMAVVTAKKDAGRLGREIEGTSKR